MDGRLPVYVYGHERKSRWHKERERVRCLAELPRGAHPNDDGDAHAGGHVCTVGQIDVHGHGRLQA